MATEDELLTTELLLEEAGLDDELDETLLDEDETEDMLLTDTLEEDNELLEDSILEDELSSEDEDETDDAEEERGAICETFTIVPPASTVSRAIPVNSTRWPM